MPAYKGIFVADPCSFTAELGSESVTFVFDRAKMTLRHDREMKQALKADDVDGMARNLLEVLTGWDVVDDAGAPVPLVADILLDLPAKALGAVIEGIGEASVPASAEGNVSASTSSGPTPSSSSEPESRQNGLQPSHSLPLSASP